MYNTSELSVDDKLRLLAGKNGWQTEDLDGKLRSASLADGPLGVRKTAQNTWGGNVFEARDLPAVAYPSMEVLSQTWNTALAKAMGACIADDCIEKDVDILLGPGVNIKRSPTCGRNFEYFSEDPYVAGTLAREYISGMQAGGIGATLKHYLANNNEIGRMWASSNVDERTLREIYMRAFEIAMEAKPWAVMTSYNILNGTRVSNNDAYMDILRNELGHGDRIIMSDWDAVKDKPASVKSGHDLEMPYNEKNLNALRTAYADGKITEEEIDRCAKRVLAYVDTITKAAQTRKVSRTIEERRKVAQQLAEEGIVLLKNNGVLPIRNGQSVAWTAQKLDRYYVGGGSACVVPEQEPMLLSDCLQTVLPDSEIVSAAVCSWGDEYVRCFTNADKQEIAVVSVGTVCAEGSDRTSIRLTHAENDEWLIKTIAKRNPNTVVVVYGGGVVDVSNWINDVAAVLYVGFPGQMGNQAIANVLSGRVNPSGKLAETFAKHLEDYPSENIDFDGLNYNYKEKLDVGYRYFDKHPEKVQFPFGFGLSYTKFQYSDLQITLYDEKCIAAFQVANTGTVDGAEVSQIYVRAVDSKVEKPVKELRGYAKTFLKAGQSQKISVELDCNVFRHYDADNHCWHTDAGDYEVIVAENAQSPCLCAMVKVI